MINRSALPMLLAPAFLWGLGLILYLAMTPDNVSNAWGGIAVCGVSGLFTLGLAIYVIFEKPPVKD